MVAKIFSKQGDIFHSILRMKPRKIWKGKTIGNMSPTQTQLKTCIQPFILSDICQQSKWIFSLLLVLFFVIEKIIVTNNSAIDIKCQQLSCFVWISHRS
jgi:hypothetical protein